MTWAVVQCEARREAVVTGMLWLAVPRKGEREIRPYFPRIKIGKRVAALFPGYIFVQNVIRWYDIQWMPWVIRVLMSGDKPACIPDQFIHELQKRERNGLVKLPQPPRLHRGQRVRVTSGPMAGQLGIYEGMTSKDRERVLLELLGRQVRIELSAKHLEPITAGDVSRKAS